MSQTLEDLLSALPFYFLHVLVGCDKENLALVPVSSCIKKINVLVLARSLI